MNKVQERVANAIARAYIPDVQSKLSVIAEIGIEFIKHSNSFNYDKFKAACLENPFVIFDEKSI